MRVTFEKTETVTEEAVVEKSVDVVSREINPIVFYSNPEGTSGSISFRWKHFDAAGDVVREGRRTMTLEELGQAGFPVADFLTAFQALAGMDI